MAATREEARGARAEGRARRRSAGAADRGEPERARDQDSDGSGKAETSTAALVLASAAVGAIAGTVRLIADRRRGRSGDRRRSEDQEAPDTAEGGTADNEDAEQEPMSASDDAAEDEATSAGPDGKRDQPSRRGDGRSGLRGAVAAVLDAAASAFEQSPSEPGERSDGAGSSGDPDGENDPGDDDEEGERDSEDEDELEAPPSSEGSGATGDDAAEGGGEPRDGGGKAARDEDEDQAHEGEVDDGRREESHAHSNGHAATGPVASVEVVRRAREQLAELVGRAPEAVSRVEKSEGGWALGLEVVELERIPHSTDVLASYDVEIDDDGDLLRYARRRRYYRNRAEEELF